MTGGNTPKIKLKIMPRLFAKSSRKQENNRISRLKKRLRNLYNKENFKPEIRVMINNLQDEHYTLETKQATGAKVHANIRWDLEGEKCSKSFFSVLERQNMQNQTIPELYTDDKKTKYSNNLQDILKSAKNFYKDLYVRGNISKDVVNELLNKIPHS